MQTWLFDKSYAALTRKYRQFKHKLLFKACDSGVNLHVPKIKQKTFILMVEILFPNFHFQPRWSKPHRTDLCFYYQWSRAELRWAAVLNQTESGRADTCIRKSPTCPGRGIPPVMSPNLFKRFVSGDFFLIQMKGWRTCCILCGNCDLWYWAIWIKLTWKTL